LSIIIVIVEAGVVGDAASVATRQTGAAAGATDAAGTAPFQPSDRRRGDLDRFLTGGADGLVALLARGPFFCVIFTNSLGRDALGRRRLPQRAATPASLGDSGY
jgi:hypothetical protein